MLSDKRSFTYTYMQTATGRKFELLDPKPDMIWVKDIVHSLSNQVRYTGHTGAPVTIANHTMRVVDLCMPYGVDAMKWAALHDVHETWVGDLATPLKNAIHELAGQEIIRELEDRIDGAVCARFEFVPTDEVRRIVKKADYAAMRLEVERDVNLGHPRYHHGSGVNWYWPAGMMAGMHTNIKMSYKDMAGRSDSDYDRFTHCLKVMFPRIVEECWA